MISAPAASSGSSSARAGVRSTLIFDFDGTLADTLAAIVHIINSHSEEFRIPTLSESDVERMRSLSGREMLRHYEISRLRLPKLVRHSQKELHKRIDEIELFPGIRELVLRLKAEGFRLGILTSNSGANVHKLLRARDLDVFDFIHSETRLFGKKRALRRLLRRRRLRRDEVVYVGDEVRDIEACRKVPIPVISVSWGFHRREKLASLRPDYLVDSPAEILAIVLG